MMAAFDLHGTKDHFLRTEKKIAYIYIFLEPPVLLLLE